MTESDTFVTQTYDHNEYVDFSDFVEEEQKKPDSLYTREGKTITFDDKTMNYYKTLRFRKMDPILLAEYEDDNCLFKFYHEWNPYTGERLGKDPYGPICFHPDSLIRYYYLNRLNDLWSIIETEQLEDAYEGHYDVAVGAGEDVYIQSRGFNPDKYLFRLPIIDCYWTQGTKNESIVTMGPKLSDDEVKQIDILAKKCGSNYLVQYKAQRPSLVEIKRLYDMAVSKTPAILVLPAMTPQAMTLAYAKANRTAVDKLKVMKG